MGGTVPKLSTKSHSGTLRSALVFTPVPTRPQYEFHGFSVRILLTKISVHSIIYSSVIKMLEHAYSFHTVNIWGSAISYSFICGLLDDVGLSVQMNSFAELVCLLIADAYICQRAANHVHAKGGMAPHPKQRCPLNVTTAISLLGSHHLRHCLRLIVSGGRFFGSFLL